MDSKKGTLIFMLLAILLVKVTIAIFVPLGIDESYYLLYARYFDWHYYDHPFMTGAVLKFFTASMKFEHPFFYRLPFIAASVVATYFIYATGKFLKNSVAGWIAVLLFTASPYLFIVAGIFTMPDAIMTCCWTIAMHFAARLLLENNLSKKSSHVMLILFGVFAGLAMASKIHAALLWVGFLGYVIIFRRDFFRNGIFWLSAFISIAAWFPMFFWNMQNDWVHFAFYNSRVGTGGGVKWTYFIREIAGECLYQNPIVWLSIFIFSVRAVQNKKYTPKQIFLLFFSLPLLLLIWTVAMFRETLPHWSGPAYIALILLASVEISESTKPKNKLLRMPVIALIFSFILIVTGACIIHFYPGTFGKKEGVRNYGQHDFTLDMYGWEKSGENIANAISSLGLQSTPIYINNWFPGSQIDEYIARKSGNPVFGVGDLSRIHQYKWINQRRGGIPESDSALFIVASNYPADPEMIYGSVFSNISCVSSLPEKRRGKITRYFHIYLMCARRK